MGDADAVVSGDYSNPRLVSYFFNRTEEGTDDAMLRLLEPFRPHRFYVLAVIMKSGVKPKRRGPRGTHLRDRLR